MSKKKEQEMATPEQETSNIELSRRHFLGGSLALTAGLSLAGVAKVMKASPAEAAQAVAATQAPAAPPPPQRKSLSAEHGRCSGCYACVYACGLHHENAVRPATARVHVRRYYGMVDVPIICWHCPDAPCVAACPVTPKKAIAKDEKTNIITYTDENLCLGATCNLCIQACPPQYLRRHPNTGRPIFCDLCGGDPKCVPACQIQAKESGEVLRADNQIGGLHMSFREKTPEMLADGLMHRLFYPNVTGDRRY